MKDWKIIVLAVVVAGLAAYAGFQLSAVRPMSGTDPGIDPAYREVTATNPAEVRIKDLEGREHSLSEWAGKILVVNFWATWCPPCVIEIPAFVELQTTLGARGLQFVGIALDDPVAAATFATARGINYPVLAGEDDVAQLMQRLGNHIGALPFTVVFDRSGAVVHTQQGEWAIDDARHVLEPLLDPPAPARQVARSESAAPHQPGISANGP